MKCTANCNLNASFRLKIALFRGVFYSIVFYSIKEHFLLKVPKTRWHSCFSINYDTRDVKPRKLLPNLSFLIQNSSFLMKNSQQFYSPGQAPLCPTLSRRRGARCLLCRPRSRGGGWGGRRACRARCSRIYLYYKINISSIGNHRYSIEIHYLSIENHHFSDHVLEQGLDDHGQEWRRLTDDLYL